MASLIKGKIQDNGCNEYNNYYALTLEKRIVVTKLNERHQNVTMQTNNEKVAYLHLSPGVMNMIKIFKI